MSEFQQSFKTRLINKIDDIGTDGLMLQVEDYVELSHNTARVRMEVEDVVEQIKSDHWDIDVADDVRSGLDDWAPTEEVYTAAQEQAVFDAGITECFEYLASHFGEAPEDVNALYSAVFWDMRGAIEAAFYALAEEVEEESEEG